MSACACANAALTRNPRLFQTRNTPCSCSHFHLDFTMHTSSQTDFKAPATLLEPIRSLIQENRKRDKKLMNVLKEIPSESGVSLVCVEAEQLAEQLTLVRREEPFG